ncbi:hypothetical protein ALGA_1378 [Labilibaculum antarcticum]|uniref:Uncharacterized protein n=1 Tax=Labilibaculum antarcticum TaxID=1717717 RepID=A0A1Y1CIB0_9BACT|nr:hypothetical protein ALGA_1378 [Labilibaculum antarcticum]
MSGEWSVAEGVFPEGGELRSAILNGLNNYQLNCNKITFKYLNYGNIITGQDVLRIAH